jgi:hypothetical protein
MLQVAPLATNSIPSTEEVCDQAFFNIRWGGPLRPDEILE